MRISDWSSDVCSSDLHVIPPTGRSRCVDDQQQDRIGNIHREQRIGPRQYLREHELLDMAENGDQLPSGDPVRPETPRRSEEHTSELQSLMRISYAVFCLKKKKNKKKMQTKNDKHT